MNKRTRQFHKNKGFTLVELVVVLVLLGILVAMGVSGILSWQDYSRFKQENTDAETIFYAVQNQFTEYNASGVYKEKVINVLDGADLKLKENPSSSNGLFHEGKIFDSEGTKYEWDSIWANAPSGDKTKYQGSIYSIHADAKTSNQAFEGKSDYDVYLAYLENDSVSIDKGTKLLFDLITPYISDRSILSGSILVEFSPEAGQVFSVCYSDRAGKFVYSEGSGDSVSVLNRDEAIRHELMMGYYAADTLSMPLVGRSKGEEVKIKLVNGNTLDLVVVREANEAVNDTDYDVRILRASNGEIDKEDVRVNFSIPMNQIKTNTSLELAVKNPAKVKVTLADKTTKYDVRIPVWIDTSNGGSDIHIVLDAADVQAQSYLYEQFLGNNSVDDYNSDSFRNTFSFYRLGIDMNEVKEIGCAVKQGDSEWGYTENANTTSPVFAYYSENESAPTYGIKNGRHLYNVRFETDYKSTKSYAQSTRIFKLENDIDWNEFINKTNIPGKKNYFLNSYMNTNDSSGKRSGIDFDGQDYSINRADNITNDNAQDTSNYAFPGFRSLGKNDTFTGKKDGAVGSYTISNLTITYAANMAYGVYGMDSKNEWESNDLSQYGLYSEEKTGSEIHDSQVNANKGHYPLGLFAENDGNINNLSLNAHKVIGMELLRYDMGDSSKVVLVYTNMVGGFAGNNVGRLSDLSLRDVNELSDKDTREKEAGITFVNGKTDVGGIMGRESWTVYSSSETFGNLSNYGKVTGMENVGGIVGRAYVIRDYLGGANDMLKYDGRFQYYDDGYDLYGEYIQGKLDTTKELKSIAGYNVSRITSITLKDCLSHGEVRGDDLIHARKLVYVYENKLYLKKDNTMMTYENTDYSNRLYRCANIGGIAGITMDGWYIDNNNTSNWLSQKAPGENKAFWNSGTLNYPGVTIENCNAYRLYSSAELNLLESDGSSQLSTSYNEGEETKKSHIRDMLEHDYYVGGLVGYSRLTLIKNSGNEISSEDEALTASGYKAFVFGRNYVGGLFGCFDMSQIIGNIEFEGGSYNIKNDTNVIGVMMVGGFAGGMGIGDESQKYFSFKHPSTNEGSLVSQINGAVDKFDVKGIVNTGVVLGIKREKLDYSNNGLVMLQDIDIINNLSNYADTDYYYQGFGIRQSIASPSGPDSNVGGITGATRLRITNVYNKQSHEIKNYILSLIGINKDIDELSWDDFKTSDIWENSFYGGNSVGGLVGKMCESSHINRDNNTTCRVDAVVVGSDSVGGIIGTGVKGSNKANAYPDGAVIIGRDMVGGLVGNLQTSFVDTVNLEASYTVYGRYAVGGAIGASNQNISPSVNISGAKVRGRAYVGGYAGLITTNSGTLEGTINDVDVKADYYAGGVIGAIYTSATNESNYYLTKSHVVCNKAEINAIAFAGGFVGLYAHHNSSNDLGNRINNTQCLLVDNQGVYNYVFEFTGIDNKNPDNLEKQYSYNLTPQTSHLVSLGNSLNGSDLSGVLSVIDTYEKDKKALTLNSNKNLRDISFDEGYLPVSENISVTADIYAGGVFGYIPNGQRLTIDLGCERSTEESTSFAPINVSVKTDSKITLDGKDYSYAGGVIGKVSGGLTIKNAAYSGGIIGNGSYLGQISEVNDGTISSSKVMSYGAGSSNSSTEIVGGIVGRNNAIITKDNGFANGITLEGSKVLGGLIGENRADFTGDNSLNGWSLSDSEVSAIRVLGDSAPSGSAIGLISGYNYGTIDLKGSSISATKLAGAETVGSYFGVNYGAVSNSAISGQNVYDAIASTGADVRISAQLFANGSTYAGLISGRNVGTISDILIADDNCNIAVSLSESTASYVYAGAICGAVDGGDSGAILKNCYNLSSVGASSGGVSCAAGITGAVTGSVQIENCVNTGDIVGSELSAGIAAKANGNGTFTMCRSYGESTYGIVSDSVASINKCFAVGKNEQFSENSNEGSNNYYIVKDDCTAESTSESGSFADGNGAWPLRLYIYNSGDQYIFAYKNGESFVETDVAWSEFDPFDAFAATGYDRFNKLDGIIIDKMP